MTRADLASALASLQISLLRNPVRAAIAHVHGWLRVLIVIDGNWVPGGPLNCAIRRLLRASWLRRAIARWFSTIQVLIHIASAFSSVKISNVRLALRFRSSRRWSLRLPSAMIGHHSRSPRIYVSFMKSPASIVLPAPRS